MSDLADLLASGPPKRGGKCKVARWLEAQDDRTRKAAEAAIADWNKWPTSALATALGFSNRTFEIHRKGTCSCD